MADTAKFDIIQSNTYDRMKKDLISLTRRVASIQSKLQMEAKIREAAVSFAKNNSSDPKQAKKAKEQLSHANKKVDTLANDLWRNIDRLRVVEHNVFCHLSGVLRWEVARSQKFQDSDSIKDIANYEQKLKSAEYKIKELEQSSSVLNSTISKLESENEDLLKKIDKYEDELKQNSNDNQHYDDLIKDLYKEIHDLEDEMRSKENSRKLSNEKLNQSLKDEIYDLKNKLESTKNKLN
ncbi:Up-regulated during septation-domain-containing protein, partial [Neocallimastix lanati (nom. inval.)]